MRRCDPLTPNTVELIPTLGALSPRGGPVQDPVRTRWAVRCRANMARVRQLRPDSGLGFQVKVPKTFKLTPFRSDAARQQLNLETESVDGAMRMEQRGWRGEEGGSERVVWAGWRGGGGAMRLGTAVELGTYKTVKARFRLWLAGKSS